MTTQEGGQWVILERYHVLGEVGRGAMGIVYKVHDDRLDRVIALKAIRKDRYVAEEGSEQSALDRFRREARAAGKLSHPGIVTVYDIGEEGDDLYIAMEFVAGSPLGERLRASSRLPLADAASIALRVCEALAYAHTHGVIHRDVKPDNIMCCADGEVKLTDFGIARIVSGSGATHTGRPLGTPRYMAPEQWRGDPVDGRTDVFAVGIILYEMLTGCPTFATKSPSELRDRVLHEEPPLPTLVNPALPAAIDPIVRRAIARAPADRYADAGELAEALAPFAAGAAGAPGDAPDEAVTVVRPDPGEAVTVLRSEPDEAAPLSATAVPRPRLVPGRTLAVAAALALVVLGLMAVRWATRPPRTLPPPPLATAAPVAVASPEDPPAAIETAPAVETTAPVAAATPLPEVAPEYGQAGTALADPERTDGTKLEVVAALATDSSAAATDVLLSSTRNASILVSMAAIKALAGRGCARITEPLTALLADEEWQRRAWAAKILGEDGCVAARTALAARRDLETDARVTKLVNDALARLAEEETER